MRSPPVFHATPVGAPAIPTLPVAPDASTFGWVRARQIVRTLDRVGARGVVDEVQRKGIDLGQLDPERPLVIVAGDPGTGGIARTPIAALVPVPLASPLATMAQSILGPANVTAFEGMTAIAVNRAPIVAGDASGGAALVRAIAQGALFADVGLFVHVAALTSRYAADIKSALDTVEREMMKPHEGQAPLSPALVGFYRSWMQGLVDSLHSVDIGFSAGDTSHQLYVVSRDKGAPAPGPESSSLPNLAQFVPPGDFRLEMGGEQWKRTYDFASRMYREILKSDPALQARVIAIFDEWNHGLVESAMSFQIDGDHLMRATAVMASTNAERQLEAMHKGVALINEGLLKKVLTQTKTDVVVTTQREARKVEGWPVDHFSYTVKLDTAKLKPTDAELFGRLFGRPIEAEIARVGTYLVFTVNEPPAALDKLVGDLLAGKGSAPPLAARRVHPPGGWLYLDVDVPRALRDFTTLLPVEKRGNMPTLDETLPPVTLFGYSPNGVGYYRLDTPRALVDAIRKSVADRATAAPPAGILQPVK